LAAEPKKYAYMEGWGLAVLGWKTDKELGDDKIYLALHKNSKKWSIWASAIFGAPANVTANITAAALNATNATENDTEDANATNATAAPATPPPAAPAAPATPPAAGAAAPAGNSSNSTNASNKTNKSKNATKKKLPTPYEGDDSEDDNTPKNLTFDLNDEDEGEGDDDDTMREKVMKASKTYELPAGYVHFKFLKWLKFFDTDTD
jgi:hypothetical protein